MSAVIPMFGAKKPYKLKGKEALEKFLELAEVSRSPYKFYCVEKLEGSKARIHAIIDTLAHEHPPELRDYECTSAEAEGLIQKLSLHGFCESEPWF